MFTTKEREPFSKDLIKEYLIQVDKKLIAPTKKKTFIVRDLNSTIFRGKLHARECNFRTRNPSNPKTGVIFGVKTTEAHP